MPPRTVDEVISRLKMTPRCAELPAPACTGDGVGPRIALGVSSMQHHTTDEGWVLIEGLRHAGWQVFGHGYPPPHNLTDVRAILDRVNPSVAFVNDVREWNGGSFRDPLARFTNIESLAERPDIFKVGVSKDSHNSVEMCNGSFRAMGAHAFQHNYHPLIVKHVNPGLRAKHLIRSWHSIEPANVPPFDKHKRDGCIFSGAISPVYPLRERILANLEKLPKTVYHPHPGYRRDGCVTPLLLDAMSHHKVAIVTSSVFGYSLRKFVEATAAGCRIITDLPVDEVMPEIDGNLTRVGSDVSIGELRDILLEMYSTYDPKRQKEIAEWTKMWYDWRVVGLRLAAEIESMRRNYGVS